MQESMVDFACSQSLKEDQLIFIICSVEQLSNERPLTECSSDSADLEALTLTHVFSGRSTFDYPKVVFNGESAIMMKSFWAHSPNLEGIWDRWIREYLPQLTARKI